MIGCTLNHTNTRFSHDPKKGLNWDFVWGSFGSNWSERIEYRSITTTELQRLFTLWTRGFTAQNKSNCLRPFYRASAVAVRLKGVGAEGFSRTDWWPKIKTMWNFLNHLIQPKEFRFGELGLVPLDSVLVPETTHRRNPKWFLSVLGRSLTLGWLFSFAGLSRCFCPLAR